MEVLCNILFEFGIQMILVRLIKRIWKKTCSRVWVANICLKYSLLRMIWSKEMLYAIVFQLCFRECHKEGSGKSRWLEIKWYTSAYGL